MTKVFQILANSESESWGAFALVLASICLLLRIIWKIIKENKSINITKDPRNNIDELTIGPKGFIKLKKKSSPPDIDGEIDNND